MTDSDLIRHLRVVASYHIGVDLLDRLAYADRMQQQQREALSQAADRIEQLLAQVAKPTAETQSTAHLCG